MGTLLYIIAIILAIAWAIGFFVYAASGLIHILLAMALITLAFRFIKR
ncbi:MAG: lmo0937 family membrane protein [Bacteroidetes bacterium]|nr:MAG: lmo0937 family membrane protein [Bacteroidota bacterium]